MNGRWIAVSVVFLAMSACGDDDDDGGGYAGGTGNPSGVGNHCDNDADCQTGDCYLGPEFAMSHGRHPHPPARIQAAWT